MKLTPPPPTPPEPPEPPESSPDSGMIPGGPGEAAAKVVVDEPSTSEPAAKPEPKPATWPGWFASFDAALAGVAIVIGFLAASFAARNSDLWLHLGAGRMLTTGEYSLGSDPLSYTGADRLWVNNSWLFDLGSYAAYSLDDDGFSLVLIKAAAVVAAFALLIAIRRPEQPLWPWAVFAVLGVVAAAPVLVLSPLIASLLFLAITLFLLFRVPNPPGSWRIPIAIGVVFWFWANTDSWFILGPLTVALLLIGEFFQSRGAAAGSGEASDSLLPLPNFKTLARALLIGIVACILNPHHVRVWQLPDEIYATLTASSIFAADPDLRPLVVSPLSSGYWSDPLLGYSLNGLAYAVLLVAGLYAVALTGPVGRLFGPPFDVDPLPLPHAILWGAFAVLSLVSANAIPFLAAVTVPLAASRLNLFSGRVRLGNYGDRNTRLVLTGSVAGRTLTLVLLVLLGLAAWPGWLHPPGWGSPPGWHPSETRRVAWAVEPDPALVEAARQFQQWRESGDLGTNSRGIITSVDLANYCAWFAPREKVFLDGRFRHHGPELADFAKLRSSLNLYPQNEPGEGKKVSELMGRHGADYLAVTATHTDPLEIRQRVEQTTNDLWRSWARWTPWAIQGQTAVFGWRADPAKGEPEFKRLHLDAIRLAFGPDVARLPPGEVHPVPRPREWIDDFFRPVQPAPKEASEAIAWLRYKSVLQRRQADYYQLQLLFLRNVPGGAPPLLANSLQTDAWEMHRRGSAHYSLRRGSPEAGTMLAIPLIALRASWRAIAANPDDPDGYFALAKVLEDQDLPLGEAERFLGRITAYRQCLSRLPSPNEYRPGIHMASPTDAAVSLTQLYLNPFNGRIFRGVPVNLAGLHDLVGEAIVVQGQTSARIPWTANVNLPANARVLGGPFVLPLDLAQRTIVLAQDYAVREFAAEPAEQRDQKAKALESLRKSIESELTGVTGRYRTAQERPETKLRDRYYIARTLGLVGEAIAILKEKEGELGKEFGPDAPRVALELAALELVCGRLEDSSADLASLRDGFDENARQNPEAAPSNPQVLLRQLEYRKLILEGNYAAAGSELESLDGNIVRAKFDSKLNTLVTWPFEKLEDQWPIIPMLGATDGPLGVLSRLALGRIQLAQYLNNRAQIASVLDTQAAFFFQRGYLSLLEGDIPAARERFRQSLEECRPPPGNWGLTAPRMPAAVDYSRLIDLAKQKAAKR